MKDEKQVVAKSDLMEPVQSDPVIENGNIIEQKPYYLAHSNIESLALLDQENKGANWLK